MNNTIYTLLLKVILFKLVPDSRGAPDLRKVSILGGFLPTPVFLPGESHGQRDLVGCGLWGCKELDRTKQLTHTLC